MFALKWLFLPTFVSASVMTGEDRLKKCVQILIPKNDIKVSKTLPHNVL